MTRRALVVLALLECVAAAILAASAVTAAAPPPALGPPGAPPLVACDAGGGTWFERAGEGLACLSLDEARRARLRDGDRVDAGGARTRTHPARVELVRARVDANRASLAELASLPGLGPRVAAAIVAGRPWSSIDDLRDLPGVGRKRLRTLRARLLVEPDAPRAE